MFGNSSFAEAAFANVGGVLQVATAEMSALGTSSSIGSGTLVGVSSISGNFTKTTAGILITGSVNAEVSSNFTQTTQGNHKFNGTSSQQFSFTKTATGDILFEEVVTNANIETYTEITPSGTENWTEIQ